MQAESGSGMQSKKESNSDAARMRVIYEHATALSCQATAILSNRDIIYAINGLYLNFKKKNPSL